MMTVADMIRAALAGIGADGLCNCEESCGCGIEDLAPCECINLSECVAAKYRAGYYRAIE